MRTRYAPSPTGALHMGGARTALFNYLAAKKAGGEFVLRIEDTDKERSRKEWEEDILDSLEWLGIVWDGEVVRQSDRASIHREYLEKLMGEGRAYECFCTTEELHAVRQDQMSRGEAPRYTRTCRNLTAREQEEKRKEGRSSVIRFVVEPRTTAFEDLVRGTIEFDMALAGDTVIAKDLNTPLYNFAVVVDDHLGEITHVIRGEDHISNTPLQIQIAQAIGAGKVSYAHLPLLLGKDRSKLSKRHGDNAVAEFRRDGYLPQAVVNFLALLGWNPGDNREVFSLRELEKAFSLQRVQKGGAVFNLDRLDWLNAHYIKNADADELIKAAEPYLPGRDVKTLLPLFKERLKKLSDLPGLASFLFKAPSYDAELLSWKGALPEETKENLAKAQEVLEAVEEWNESSLRQALMKAAREDRGGLLWPLRVALTGLKASPGPFEVAAMLGREESVQRVKKAIEKL